MNTKITGMPPDENDPACYAFYCVQKLRFQTKDRKDTLIYNGHIRIENIPAAHEYIVNGRSGLECLIDRYQIKTDKASGITNDPNDWSREYAPPDTFST